MRTAPHALFDGLIDYAGLFPPASLSIGDAVAEYRFARSGGHGRMLGRFICPASRLEELGGVLMTTMASGEQPWQVSAILDGAPGVAAVATHSFDSEMDPGAKISLVEKALSPTAGLTVAEVGAVVWAAVDGATAASPTATLFLELARTVPDDAFIGSLSTTIEALAAAGTAAKRTVGAKLRCGGLTPESFPTSRVVTEFVWHCAAASVPFKVTAGLHHPVRHFDEEVGTMRHGFVNLLAAAAAAESGATVETLMEIVDDADASSFSVSAATFSWQGTTFSVRHVDAARRAFEAYGSCSFVEPTRDLLKLGMVKV